MKNLRSILFEKIDNELRDPISFHYRNEIWFLSSREINHEVWILLGRDISFPMGALLAALDEIISNEKFT